MPYKFPSNIPEGIKGLPEEAQKDWITIFNSAYEEYKNRPEGEALANATAWAGLRRAGWGQKDGKWTKISVKKESPAMQVMEKKSIDKKWEIDFVKVEEEQRLVTGIVIEPEVEDSYGDIISVVEIEKAMVHFMEKGPEIRIEHNPDSRPKVAIIENWIEREGKVIGEQFVKAGTWLMTTKILDDKVWEMIKSGELTGYSFRGPGLGIIEQGVV